MDWLEITVKTTSEETAEILEAELGEFAQDDEGVATEQQGDSSAQDPSTLLPEISVKLFVRNSRDTPELRADVANTLASFNLPIPEFRSFKDEDWENAWKAHYKPTRVGNRILIQPSWLELDPTVIDQGLAVLTLDPGLAFGSGTHETTQLCLRSMEELLRPGDRLLDLGTGSGILAIDGVLLGAEHVVAIDNDPRAVASTIENAERNGVATAIEASEGTLAEAGNTQYDMVVANILAPVLLSMFEEGLLERLKPGGHLVLSGILERLREVFEQSVIAHGGTIIGRAKQGRWAGLVVKAAGRS